MNLPLKVKIFADGADLNAMLEMAKHPLVKGLTTNPSLMRKAGVTDYPAYCKKVLSEIPNLPISFEVFADDMENMRRQGLEIASWGKNVYVKIPITNTEGQSTTKLVSELSHQGVSLNVTAIMTLNQVLETCQALKGGAPSIVSVFAGRVADTGRDPMALMTACSEVCRSTDSNIELLWASSREVLNVVQADQSGCHIITATNDIIKKLSMWHKDLELLSLETVRQFKSDAGSAGFSL